MGGICSEGIDDKDERNMARKDNNNEEEKKSEAKPQQQEKKKFVVRPFAVMRLTHEAIRAGMKEVKVALEKVSDDCSNLDEIRKIYVDLERCIVIHAKQEDQIFFPLLNEKFDGVINNENIPPKHDDDGEQREKIKSLLENGCDSKDELSKIINEWLDAHEAHLKLEEQVMMPLTMKTADTVEKRGEIVRSIINVDRKEFSEYQFEYVLGKLFVSKPFGPLMMYCKATQMASNAQEYNEVKGKIEGVVGEEMWNKLKSKGCAQDGKQQ